MLDECKGERLEEVLAVFSNVVLKKVLQEAGETQELPIAQQLAFENFSYSGERTALSTLILAHKASLRSHILWKKDAKARYRDFADLMNLNDRRIARRHEQLNQAIEERGTQENTIPDKEVRALQDQLRKNWLGRDEWLESILYGDSRVNGEGLLATKFDKVWKHVEDGSIADVEGKKQVGLLEQLDARVRDQETRLARWQDFGKTLSKPENPSPSKKSGSTSVEGKRIDLGFNLHESLQISRNRLGQTVEAITHASLEEYTRLIENMKTEMANVGRTPTRQRSSMESFIPEGTPSTTASPIIEKGESPIAEANDEAWSSASDIDEPSPDLKMDTIRPVPEKTAEVSGVEPEKESLPNNSQIQKIEDPHSKDGPGLDREEASVESQELHEWRRSPSPKNLYSHTPQQISIPEPTQSGESESDLADQILNSISASSPSPKKNRHTLSLAERTRLSMSRASHSKYSDLHDDLDNLADLPRLSIRPKPQPAKRLSIASEEDKHADLIERTRKSMAGFEAAQKKAQIERRRSLKDAQKRQRESSYFPKVEEEPITPSIDPVELIEGDPDYESVFKSRPRIKTSPAASPMKVWGDESED
jgi:hypothetical protein